MVQRRLVSLEIPRRSQLRCMYRRPLQVCRHRYLEQSAKLMLEGSEGSPLPDSEVGIGESSEGKPPGPQVELHNFIQVSSNNQQSNIQYVTLSWAVAPHV